METKTRIYLSDLTDEVKENLLNEVIEMIKSDPVDMAEIEAQIDEENEEDEITNETPDQRKWKLQDKLEEKAKDYLNRTFYGEVSFGE